MRTSKHKVLIDGVPIRLRFKVIATLSNDWSVFVYLDTRGDPGADYRLGNFEYVRDKPMQDSASPER